MFGSLMGGTFEDMLGSHMQRMNNMMSSFFGNDPLMNGGNPSHVQRSQSMSMMPFADNNNLLALSGFPNMNSMMQNMGQISNNPNCHSFSSSSVMTMTTGPNGKPQVYQASQSTRTGPGGVRETKKAVSDSRTGVKKLAVGRHIGDRGYIKEKEQNMYTGQVEENDEYINLEEEEEPEFTNEWQERTQQQQKFRSHRANHAISYPASYDPGRRQKECLAKLPAPSVQSDGKIGKQNTQTQLKKKNTRVKPYSKTRETKKEKSRK